MDRPYHLTWAQIAELTDRQIIDIYYRPRDRDGTPLPFEPNADQRIDLRPVATLEERKNAYFQMCASIGMKREEMIAKWEEALPRMIHEMNAADRGGQVKP